MSRPPTISVVIPTFNRALKLASALNSCFEQTSVHWEAIVIDDGGTDDTAVIVSKLRATHPTANIAYVRQENQGPSVARNTGVAHARGEIIVYLDSDDRLYASALDDIAWVLTDPTASFGLTNHNRTLRLIDEHQREIGRKFDASGLNRNVTLDDIYDWKIKTTSSGLFHRRRLFQAGARWKSGFYIEDLDFIMQLAVLDPPGFRHLPKVLVDYEQAYGGDGLCSNASYLDWAHAFGHIYDLHKDDPLMRHPRVYLDRVEKYEALHQAALAGRIPAPAFKYFPELVRGQ